MMTSYTAIRCTLIGFGLLAIPAGLAGLRTVEVDLDPVDGATNTSIETGNLGALDSLVVSLVDHNPFRLDRSPAAIAYNSGPVEPADVEPTPPKPHLLLTGILWGEEPSAIVEGLPGIEGARVLRVGESSGSIRIRRITRQDVTLVGMDTTWMLQVRKPW